MSRAITDARFEAIERRLTLLEETFGYWKGEVDHKVLELEDRVEKTGKKVRKEAK